MATSSSSSPIFATHRDRDGADPATPGCATARCPAGRPPSFVRPASSRRVWQGWPPPTSSRCTPTNETRSTTTTPEAPRCPIRIRRDQRPGPAGDRLRESLPSAHRGAPRHAPQWHPDLHACFGIRLCVNASWPRWGRGDRLGYLRDSRGDGIAGPRHEVVIVEVSEADRHLSAAQALDIPIAFGDATLPETLQAAGVSRRRRSPSSRAATWSTWRLASPRGESSASGTLGPHPSRRRRPGRRRAGVPAASRHELRGRRPHRHREPSSHGYRHPPRHRSVDGNRCGGRPTDDTIRTRVTQIQPVLA